MRTKCFLIAVAATLTVTASVAEAKPKDRGPVDLNGELRGAAYEIRVPNDWNGTLVVYAHGYRDAADHAGEVDDRSADAFVNDAVEERMLGAGYALAGSAYTRSGGRSAKGFATPSGWSTTSVEPWDGPTR